jgi:hypothetical protein
MKRFLPILLLALIVLHQDFWWRYDYQHLVCGFVPISLAWHIGLSVLASIVWGLTCRYAWPRDVDLPDDGSPSLGGH